jgi:hypothetical protein
VDIVVVGGYAVSPRRGGEADKLGNHYEVAWTVLQLLEVLAGRADSVTVEELGEGVEFTLRRHNGVETHQVKRQHGSANTGRWAPCGVRGCLRRRVARSPLDDSSTLYQPYRHKT